MYMPIYRPDQIKTNIIKIAFSNDTIFKNRLKALLNGYMQSGHIRALLVLLVCYNKSYLQKNIKYCWISRL